jgi:hypothetical protein
MAALPSRPVWLVLLLLALLLLLTASRMQAASTGRKDAADSDRVSLRPASPLRPMPVGGTQPSSPRPVQCAGRGATNHSASDVFELAFYINADGSLRRQKFMEVRMTLGS